MKIGRVDSGGRRGALALAVLAFFALVPTGRYLVRAGWAEGKILWRARPIAELVRDSVRRPRPNAPEARARARRARVRRRFGEARREAELHDVQSHRARHARRRAHRRVSGQAGVQDLVVSDRRQRAVQGLLRRARREEAAAALSRDGFDAYLRPATAFSTLGYLNDPLLSTTLDEDSVSLVNTVIHELTHNTFYASGQAVFNESFANFAGAHGSEWFYAARADSASVARARGWARQKTLGRFWSAVYNSVDSAFKAHPASKADRLVAREIVFTGARDASRARSSRSCRATMRRSRSRCISTMRR